MFKDPLTQKIAHFLIEIGLEIHPRKIAGDSFLSGILIDDGKLFVDEEKLAFPGDLLHEAGHLAVAPGDIRGRLSDEVDLPEFNMDSIESGAMAWSYAVALHLGLHPAVVFHQGGYKGNAEALLFNFSIGVYVGLNILEDAKMAAGPNTAARDGVDPFPHMLKWLRD